MSRNPGDVVFRCPVCGAHVDGVTPGQVPLTATPLDSLEEQIEAHTRAVVAANEALLLFHVESSHTVKEVMLALGTARTALHDIIDACRSDDLKHEAGPYLEEIADRGLGGF